jgi:hypothetical protein
MFEIKPQILVYFLWLQKNIGKPYFNFYYASKPLIVN